MNVCVNPSCSCFEVFESEDCPVCQSDKFLVTTSDYIAAFDSSESCIATLHDVNLIDDEYDYAWRASRGIAL